jgi:hypothetical protein
MTPIALDFETFFSKKLRYGLWQMIAEQYCAHDLFDCYLMSVSDGTTSWAGHPSTFNWSALEGATLLSHNARFDKTVYEELVRRKLAPSVAYADWICTANLTSYICNRRALQDSVEHLFQHRVSKEYRGVADGKHWPKDYTDDEKGQVEAAGRSDALWCWRLFDKYGPKWPQVERDLSRITVDQGMHGVAIDTERLNDYLWQTHEMLQNTEKVIPWIAGSEDDDWVDFKTKPTSTKCIAEQCRRTKIPCAPVKSDDEEAYALWEAKHGPANPWIQAVGSWRSINKLYKTFVTIKERLRSDGTLPFGLKYFGAHTGRWSGDSRVNLQNQRRRPIMCNEGGLLETSDVRVDAAMKEAKLTGKLPAWVRYVIDFRSLIVPRPGKKMIVSDLSQIEPRVLAWLTGNWDFLRRVEAGDSPYVAHARASMGFAGDKMDKESDLYKLAKARILGLGYQCGWEKFITMAQDLAGYDVTKDDPEWIEEEQEFTGKITKVSGYGYNSKRIVREFREQNPLITGLWQTLGNAFKSSIGGDFTMTLPNGRKMKYERVRASMTIEKDPVTGKPRRVNKFTADSDGKRRPFYGGKLTENLVQAVARDVFGEQVATMVKGGWDCLFTVHDEAILEVDPSVSAKEVEHAMSQCPEWLKGCPITAEAKEVAHYQK